MRRFAYRAQWHALAIFLTIAACSSVAEPAATGAAAGARAAAAAAGTPSTAAPSGGAAGTASEPVTAGDPGVPCAVSKALANACHSCHGPVPTNGAPMPLVVLADFHTLSVAGKPKVPKYQLALMRIDGSRSPLMPPGGAITEQDKKTLIDWLSDGALATTATCD